MMKSCASLLLAALLTAAPLGVAAHPEDDEPLSASDIRLRQAGTLAFEAGLCADRLDAADNARLREGLAGKGLVLEPADEAFRPIIEKRLATMYDEGASSPDRAQTSAADCAKLVAGQAHAGH